MTDDRIILDRLNERARIAENDKDLELCQLLRAAALYIQQKSAIINTIQDVLDEWGGE